MSVEFITRQQCAYHVALRYVLATTTVVEKQ